MTSTLNGTTSEVRYKRVLVTPELALTMLDRNIEKNRTVRQNLIDKYASDMEAGRWEENGETIKFAFDGTLLDGQHRLCAVIQSETNQWFHIAENVPKTAFETIDTGARRTTADYLKFEGFGNTNLVASSAKLLYQYIKNDYSNKGRNVSNSVLLKVARENPELETISHASQRLFKATKMNGTAATVFLYLARRNPKLNEFVEGLISGANLPDGDTRLALRNFFMMKGMEGGTTAQRKMHLYAAIMAFNEWLTGRTRKQYRPSLFNTELPPKVS